MADPTIYKCTDGTDFPVEWNNPDDASQNWRWDEGHWPTPLKPFDIAVWTISESTCQRVFEEADVPVFPLFRGRFVPHGFLYLNYTLLADDQQIASHAQIERFTQKFGGAIQVWQEYSLPRITENCTRIQESSVDVPTTELADMFSLAFFQTMVAFHPINLSWQQLTEFLVGELGPDAGALSIDLISGKANATLEADQALWEVAQIARNYETLRHAVLLTEPNELLDEVNDMEGGRGFVSAFQQYIEDYGWRAQQWETSSPTWRERPDIALGFIKQMIEDNRPAPVDANEDVVQASRETITVIEERLGADLEKRARFRQLAENAAPYITVREGRAYWQLVAYGSLRAAMLRKGRRLVEFDAIEQDDDVLYLVPDEIDSALNRSGDSLKSLIEVRRAEWMMWCTKRPPVAVGVQPATTQADDDEAESGNFIRGVAAGRGVVTARARVIRDLSEADKLLQGEVMVCVMTAPPWTMLFSKASAVVTDTGSVLSHASIASREYGIPCVAGTQNATTRIKDGMLITVDGTKGTVRIED